MAAQLPIAMKYVLPQKPTVTMNKITDKKQIEKYVVREDEHVDFSIPTMDPSIIDFQLLINSEEEVQKFGDLLNTWGCIQLVNHGITSAKLDEVREIWKDFYTLPVEEKQKYIREANEFEGWGGDNVIEGDAFNWSDRLILTLYPCDQRNPKFWPDQSLPKFRQIIEEYGAELNRIKSVLFDAISKFLKLPEDNLLAKYGKDGLVVSRFNHYPKCPCPEQIIGIRPHIDFQFFTILLQDKQVEGLHIKKRDQWFKVPVLPDALVINVADTLEIMSNGRLKALFHRAVANDTNERMSIAFGCGPPRNVEVEPLKELIDKESQQLYSKSIRCTERYFIQPPKFSLHNIIRSGTKIKKENRTWIVIKLVSLIALLHSYEPVKTNSGEWHIGLNEIDGLVFLNQLHFRVERSGSAMSRERRRK